MAASDADQDHAAGQVRRGRPRDPLVDESILAATLELLGEAGYARLTMEQVAARARVGKASVYLRWPSKLALVAEAIRRGRPDLVPEVPDSGSLAGDMAVFLAGLVRPRDAGARALSAVTGEAASNPEVRPGLAKPKPAGLRPGGRNAATIRSTTCSRASSPRPAS
jgi:AcrR family transcriptional regulator